MNKKYWFFAIICLMITSAAFSEDDIQQRENIGYKYYTSKSPVYYFISSFDNINGDIFVDWDDNLYVVNAEGTFIYNPSGAMVSHLNERIQIPVKADGSGNIFILQQNKILKMSSQKELVSSFQMDEDSKLLHIDDKGRYHFLFLRKEFKTAEYNDEINKIDENIVELQKPVELPDTGEIDSIEQRLKDYRDEKRDTTWALEKFKVENDDYWRKYEFETSAVEKSKIKVKLDNVLDQIEKTQDRLKYIDKDVDDLKDRIKKINADKADRTKQQQTENREEIKRLTQEKENIARKIEEDKKLKYEIRIYTPDKYLSGSFPVPLSPEGLPLFSCRIIVSDRNGNFYGTDGKIVYIYDWEGNLMASFGTAGDHNGEIKSVNQLAVDSKGNIYVQDSVNNKISKFGLTKPALNSIR